MNRSESWSDPDGGTMPDVWDGDLPDVWDGRAPADQATIPDQPDGFETLYGQSPERMVRHRNKPRAADEPARAAQELGWIGHGVLPAASIAMVSALLFFLYDVRSVYLPGSLQLKWIGFCFVVATVLIARYGRMGTGVLSAGFYSAFLAFATILVMAMSPWEAPQVGVLGPLSNAVIIFLVWRFAGRLTVLLSRDLEPDEEAQNRLFGLERLEMERLEKQRDSDRMSVYEIGRRARRRRRKQGAGDPRQARLAVLRLVALGLVIFALGEPALLAGHEAAAQRALGAMIVFLASAAVILAAASSMHNADRLTSLGGRPTFMGVSGRLVATVCVMTVLLAMALGTPGLNLRGRGDIVPLAPEWRVQKDETAAREASEPTSEDEPLAEDEDRTEGEREAPKRENPRNPELNPSSLAGLLGRLGQWLKWPVIVLAVLVTLVAAWRSRGSWAGLSRAFWGRLRQALAGLLKGRGRAQGVEAARRRRAPSLREVFSDLDALSLLEPRKAVLSAYLRMLDAWRAVGHEPAIHRTPDEQLAALPRALAGIREPCGRLTNLYLRSAFSDQPTPIEDQQASVQCLREMEQVLSAAPA